jgi:hypothetical protein
VERSPAGLQPLLLSSGLDAEEVRLLADLPLDLLEPDQLSVHLTQHRVDLLGLRRPLDHL